MKVTIHREGYVTVGRYSEAKVMYEIYYSFKGVSNIVIRDTRIHCINVINARHGVNN